MRTGVLRSPPFTYNLCVGLGDLSARLGFSRAACAADLQPADSVSVVCEERFVRGRDTERLWSMCTCADSELGQLCVAVV